MSAVHPVQSDGSSEPMPEAGSGLWDMLHDMPAWGISLMVHVGVLVGLMSISWVIESQVDFELTSIIEPEDVKEEEYVISTEVTEDIGSNSDLNILGPSMAAAQDAGFDNHREEQDRIEDQLIDPRVKMIEPMMSANEAELMEVIDLTGTTEHAGGTSGAIDRLTQEIADSVRQRKTMVVWVLDESLSMESRRELVAKRFRSIYGQLKSLDIGVEESLTTGIIGYGQNVRVLVKEPTNDIDVLTKAVDEIKNDKSGVEMVFSAVNEALRVFLPQKRKQRANMMVILVTDERGDDWSMLEQTVKRCTDKGVRVYCVGNASVFGRDKGYLLTKWESNGETFEDYLPADMGPETAMAEGIQLPFWTSRARGLDNMSSGYGPYTLTRLCTETGGIFFVAEDSQGRKWDSGIMRKYAPDYRPLRDYERQIATNKAKAALIQAGRLELLSDEDIPIPELRFRADNDNVLRAAITDAQKPLARLDYFLSQLTTLLELGEKDRAKLDSDRWRAAYDLAMGRSLAMRVRAFGYNAMLAEMKSSPKSFTKPGSNQWQLVPSEEVAAGATVRRMHKKAIEYLTRVIDEHPETPWAYLASVELGDPLGWDWKENKIQIAANNMRNNANRPQFAPEEEQEMRERRRRQQIKNDSRPKL